MSAITKEISDMVDMLPQSEQEFAFEFVKRLVLAWDPDFTKLTESERKSLEETDKQIANGEVYSKDEIDWDNLDNMDLD